MLSSENKYIIVIIIIIIIIIIISDVAHDVGFPTVYRGIYCRKFLTLYNQTLRYICKCIRICDKLALFILFILTVPWRYFFNN